ncbi:ABC transporter permease [Pontibacillus litoralis]|uniref:ABC transporter permease n=1 Tax=Pontibacillus litoralis JSM 072002 TaxID=1385512 RepID=A0A0A5G0I5_9BACI|nr:ABC transporter permease [Pontibacillus litoralis]KGX86616.1 ABC transporter permease [Pontibacillus litoralis JSM 072002]
MAFLLRRCFTFFVTILIVMIMTFLVFRIIPGDPALTILGMDAEPEQIAALEKELGTDRPLYEQFLDWAGGVFTGNLGESLRFSQPVSELVIDRIPVTLSLAIMSIVITMFLAIPIGIYSAKKQGSWVDTALSITTQIGMAIPSFWLGIILMLIFGLTFKWFSPTGYVPWSENPSEALNSLFLPSLAIAIPQIAVVVRYLRTTMIEQLQLDYVRTAKSKGLKEKSILYIHVLKNALIPVITIFGMIFADVLAGSLVIEQVFALPGFGRLLISSISYRDLPLIQGMVVIIAFIVLLMNFIIDILYRWLDPRIELK